MTLFLASIVPIGLVLVTTYALATQSMRALSAPGTCAAQ